MTAIAAVLAFANPAMAQEVTPTPVTAAPVTVTPDPVATTPVNDPAPSDPLSPVAATPGEPAAAATAAPRARTTARSTRTVSRTAPAPRRATAPAPSARAAAAASPPAPTPAPVDVAPAAPIAAPLAVAPVAPPIVEPVAAQPAPNELLAENGLEIAGAAGLGLLALLGLGAAMRRRSRRKDEADFAAFEQPVEPTMAPAAPLREPAIRRDQPALAATAPVAVGKPIDAPSSSLPDGFDLSRFGPHVQAAYRGPTEDNASLSLKHRPRRASAMDQMARRDGTELAPAAEAKAPADDGMVVSRMRSAPRAGDSFMLGKGTVRPSPRPVTQH